MVQCASPHGSRCSEGRQLQRRLDVRVETSSLAARPAFLWAFQSSKKQLQAIFSRRPSLLHATAAQEHAFGLQFEVKQRQSLLACSRLSVTLAARLMCYRSACAVTHLLRQAACILSQRHKFPVLRLGAVAAVGAGFVRAIGSRGAGNGQSNRELYGPCGVVVFDDGGEGNLVVSDFGNHRIAVFRYIDGAHLRSIGIRRAGKEQFNGPWGIAFDDAGHIIVSEYSGHRVQVLRYSVGAHVRTVGSGGSGNRQFENPCGGIAIDSDGRMVVANTDRNRVQVLE
jgi:hypothetical protein